MCYSASMLEKFNELLVERNKVVNLTAHKTIESSWQNNVLDSLLFVDTFPALDTLTTKSTILSDACIKVLDLGSGCGCPAIPLKIVLPNLDITMIDSVRKKVDFLNDAVRELGLENIRAIHTRIEDFASASPLGIGGNKTRESFDIVTARAVAELPTLLEYALPFLKVGGKLLAFKGKNYQAEIDASANALSILGGKISVVQSAEIKVDKDNVERYLVIVTKIKQTPAKYPRGKNLPRLKPL